MKVPSRSFALAGGLVICEPREKTANVVQGHLVKHPIGVTSLVRGGAWSDEGWDELGVIDATTRATLISKVLRLRDGLSECSVPEIRGASTSTELPVIACDTCPVALAKACVELTASTIGARYFAVLDSLLDAGSTTGAVRIAKDALARHLFGALRSVGTLGDLVVGYAGLDGRSKLRPIVRLNRGDGVRAELWLQEPDKLEWRTLYRDAKAVATPNGRLQFLLDAPPQAKSTMPLSELCFVSRPFWEKP
jgi:hypothetical protein